MFQWSLGVHFAVSVAQAKELLAAESDRKLMEMIGVIEQDWEKRLVDC